MKSKPFLIGAVAFLFVFATFAAEPSASAKHSWGQWRGPMATGVAPEANPPLEWSETKNVKWKIKTPGFGTSTPIVWDDRVFILTAIPTGKKVVQKKGRKFR